MEENTNNSKEEINDKSNSKTCGCVIGIIISIGLIIGIFFLIYFFNNKSTPNNPDGATKLLSRSATNKDINVEVSNDLSLSMNCIVKPSTDISNLQITFKFIDKNQNLITTKNKTIGNVTKNNNYSISFALSEFGLTEIFKIQAFYAEVTGGTVSYFG